MFERQNEFRFFVEIMYAEFFEVKLSHLQQTPLKVAEKGMKT